MPLQELTGTWRRFGQDGPVYEVLNALASEDTARIRVLESGEELDYPLKDLLDDPRER